MHCGTREYQVVDVNTNQPPDPHIFIVSVTGSPSDLIIIKTDDTQNVGVYTLRLMVKYTEMLSFASVDFSVRISASCQTMSLVDD